jgi:hypothetical protein
MQVGNGRPASSRQTNAEHRNVSGSRESTTPSPAGKAMSYRHAYWRGLSSAMPTDQAGGLLVGGFEANRTLRRSAGGLLQLLDFVSKNRDDRSVLLLIRSIFSMRVFVRC